MRKILNMIKMALSVMFFISPAAFAADLKVGDPAPTFSLMDQFDQTISLNSEKGKWVVLYFYPKDQTPGCTTEACSFRDNINKLIAQKAVVLGVSLDDRDSHVAFAKKHDLPFSLLADTDGQVAAQYGSLLDFKLFKMAKRHSFIIDPNGNIAKIYRTVDPDKHVREVMADLKTLQNS